MRKRKRKERRIERHVGKGAPVEVGLMELAREMMRKLTKKREEALCREKKKKKGDGEERPEHRITIVILMPTAGGETRTGAVFLVRAPM